MFELHFIGFALNQIFENTVIDQTILYMSSSSHFILLHFVLLHFILLHFVLLHFILLHFILLHFSVLGGGVRLFGGPPIPTI